MAAQRLNMQVTLWLVLTAVALLIHPIPATFSREEYFSNLDVDLNLISHEQRVAAAGEHQSPRQQRLLILPASPHITDQMLQRVLEEADRLVHQRLHQPDPSTSQASQNLSLLAMRAEEASILLLQRLNLSGPELPTLHTCTGDTSATRPCQADAFRSADGSCNNVQHPDWGKAKSHFVRLLAPDYADAIRTPKYSHDTDSGHVSLLLGAPSDNSSRHAHLALMTATFSEFLFSDVAQTRPMSGFRGQELSCCHVNPELRHPECWPFNLTDGFTVSCQEYIRSATAPRSGCPLGPREQMNHVTSFIDASNLYGSSKAQADSLRAFDGGLLVDEAGHSNGLHDQLHPALSVGVSAVRRVWLRQHNRLCRKLAQINGHWSDEQLYQEARRIVIAQMQHITFNEFLPVILGKEAMAKYNISLQASGFSSAYDMDANPGTANSFAAAAFRFALTLFPDPDTGLRPEPQLPAAEESQLGHESQLPEEATIQSLIRAATRIPDLYMNRDSAHVLQQGRDHGLPPYVKWRSFCGLPNASSWSSLSDTMTPETVELLRTAYRGHLDQVDLFVGGRAEVAATGAVVGPTLACLIGRQMHSLKTGDRFWYENREPPSSFSPQQLHQIRKTSLAGILCATFPGILHIQPNVFHLPDAYLNAEMPCLDGSFGEPDLSAWQSAGPRFLVSSDDTLLEAFQRARRDVNVIKEMEWNLWNSGRTADPKSSIGSSYAFMKPKAQSVELSNSSMVLQFASRRFLDSLLRDTSDQRRHDDQTLVSSRRQFQQLMDALPSIDVTDIMDFSKEFECDEQATPCHGDLKFRTLTGWCNNLQFPEYGKSIRAFTRLLAPAYDDGLMKPRSRSVTGSGLPSARLVSVNIHNDVSAPHVRYSLMLMQWAQFLDHDLTHTPVNRGFSDSILECKECDAQERVHPECLPIPVPNGDPYFPVINATSGRPFCLAFTRSMPGQLTLGFREQINQITSFLDASLVYGSDLCEMRELRTLQGGRLNSTLRRHGDKELLPQTTENAECKTPSGRCFEAGDARSSEQPVLAAMHTLFLRKHNAMVAHLARVNAHWDDERLYQEARRIMAAVMQHVTYNEFLPRILGWNAVNLYDLSLASEGFYRGYDPKCNPTILNEFAAAAFRFGHSLLKPSFARMDPRYAVKGPSLKLAEMFFNPEGLMEPGMLDDLIRGVAATSMETMDQFITDEVTNHLFEDKAKPYSGLDLAALNIQRGRDHGLPGYNLYRAICNLTRADDFDQLSREIAAPVIERLRLTYAHVDDIDLFTGGLVETPLHGGLVGPTFACIIGIQFRNLKKCDRFWYETSDPNIGFSEAQLNEIRKITLAKVVCDNCDLVTSIQRSMFDIPDPFLNPRVPCGSLPGINLDLWREQTDCVVNGRHIQAGRSIRVSACTMCSCATDGTPQCRSLKIKNCLRLAQDFSPKAILSDPVCKVQCAFAFRSSPESRLKGKVPHQ